MAVIKVVKTSAYFKRFQVKFRRRRLGLTDYYARKRLIHQARNTCEEIKYRLVARILGKQVVCQIVSAHMNGDRVHAAACSRELQRYGVTVGLTNWPAAYLTGLLCARRMLKKLEKDSVVGQAVPDGTIEECMDAGFSVYLDIGLARATRGARCFAAMKGASDGGLHIPHSGARFPGYDPETKQNDTEMLRSYIYGGHIANYMRELQEDDEERFKKQFGVFIKNNVGPDDLETMYQTAINKIREDPTMAMPDWEQAESEEQRKKVKAYLAKRKPKMTRKEKKAAKNARLKKLEEEFGKLPVA